MSPTASFLCNQTVWRPETRYTSLSLIEESVSEVQEQGAASLGELKQYQHPGNDTESQIALLGHENPLPKDTIDFGSNSWRKYSPRLPKKLSSRIPTGWKLGAWIAFLQAAGVLLINIILLIYITVKTDGASDGAVYEGDCNTVGHLLTGIHLVVNILSTLLLGASNYVMQSLCAPTRIEVNKAHERNSWLDIGLQSMRNLGYTSRWKKLVWILLSASSIPLHLFYNSSFFSTVGAQVYEAYLVQGPDVRHIPESNGIFDGDCSGNQKTKFVPCPSPSPNAQWELLSATDCIQAYAVDFLTNRGQVLVVSSSTNITDITFLYTINFLDVGDQSPKSFPYDWICISAGIDGNNCDVDWRKIDPQNWTLYYPSEGTNPSESWGTVSYCLSETFSSKCQLQFNLPLLVIVIAFNAVKVVCIAIVATRMKDHPLVTVGDAIASFIDNPDPQTKNMCLATQQDFNGHNIGNQWRICSFKYNHQRIRWMNITSQRHWRIAGSLFFGAISIVLALLGYGIYQLDHEFGLGSFSSLWQLGIGKESNETIIVDWAIPTIGFGGLVASVLVANSPQLILSIIYLVFNSLCTKLCLALEWSSYAHSRKPLRVSFPHGDQRSTYFLQIPYRFGLPLMAYAALLHWLVSQSIFLVAVTYWDGNTVVDQLFSCGFSPVGMILTSLVGASLFLSALALGYFRHLDSNMPLASSCSAAIAAACHPPENGSDSLKPLQWGVVSHDESNLEQSVGHISFSSADVVEPVKGSYYC